MHGTKKSGSGPNWRRTVVMASVLMVGGSGGNGFFAPPAKAQIADAWVKVVTVTPTSASIVAEMRSFTARGTPLGVVPCVSGYPPPMWSLTRCDTTGCYSHVLNISPGNACKVNFALNAIGIYSLEVIDTANSLHDAAVYRKGSI